MYSSDGYEVYEVTGLSETLQYLLLIEDVPRTQPCYESFSGGGFDHVA